MAIFRGAVSDADLSAFCNDNTFTFHGDAKLTDIPAGTTIVSAGGSVDVSELSTAVTLKVNLSNIWRACKPFILPDGWTETIQTEGALPEHLTRYGWMTFNETTGEISFKDIEDPLPYEFTWMPMGDSITEGETHMASTNGTTGTRGGYRYQLWKSLEENGQPTRSFGFRTGHQGTEEVVNNPKWAWHCGLYGGLIKPIHNSGAQWYNVETALENAGYPDVITLMLGINDLSYLGSDDDAGITNVFTGWTQLVDKLAKNRPHSKILVSTLLPVVNGNNSDGRFGPFNDKMRAAYQKKSTPFDNANVFFVDVCALAFDNTHHPEYSKEGIHPNEEGSIITAYAFREGMQAVIAAIQAESLGVVAIHNGVAGEVRVRLNKPVTELTGAVLSLTKADGSTIALREARLIERDETVVPQGGSVDTDGRVIAFDLGNQELTAGSYTANIRAEFGSMTTLSCNVPATDIEIVGTGAQQNIPADFLPSTYVKHSTITIGNGAGNPTIEAAAKLPEAIDRVGYYMELKRPGKPAQYVWVSMDAAAFGNDPTKVGLPTADTGAHKAIVTGLEVYGNRGNFEKSVTGARGIIEFTPWSWTVTDETGYINEVRGGHCGWNDTLETAAGTAKGCLQIARIHENAAGTWLDPAAEMLLAYNHFNCDTMSDLGIGSFSPHWNNIGSSSIRPVKYDWTEISSVNQYTQYQPDAYEVKTIEVWVEPTFPLIWTGRSETWDTTTEAWTKGGTPTPFTDGEPVEFRDINGKATTTAAPSVNVTPASILIDNAATEVTLGSSTAAIIGNPVITKRGTGKLILTGPATRSAATRIAEVVQEDGEILIQGDYALLTTGNNYAPFGSKLTIKGGTFDLNNSTAWDPTLWLTQGTITLGGSSTTPAELKNGNIIPYNVTDWLIYEGGAEALPATFSANLHSVYTNNPQTRNVIVKEGAPSNGYDLLLSGTLGVSGGEFNGTTLVKKGLGTLKVSGANNLPALSITEGTFLCGSDAALSATTTVAAGATLDLANASPEVTTLTLEAGATLAVGTGTLKAGTLTVADTVTVVPSPALGTDYSLPLTLIENIGDAEASAFTLGTGFNAKLHALTKTTDGALQLGYINADDVQSLKTQGYTDATIAELVPATGTIPSTVAGVGNGKELSPETINDALACFDNITSFSETSKVARIEYTFGVTRMDIGDGEVTVEVGVATADGQTASFANGITCKLLFVDLSTGTQVEAPIHCRQTSSNRYLGIAPIGENKNFIKAHVSR